MKFTRLILCSVGFIVGALASGGAIAERSRFSDGKLSVLPATRFVNEPPNTAFRSDGQFTFTRRPTAAPRDGDADAVSVRIFSLNEGTSVPTHWAVFEPCWVYLSTLLPVRINASGTIHLGSLTEDWLHATKADGAQERRYLVVFERGPGDGHGLFRLNRAHRDDYFRHGLVIVVQPGREYSRDEIDAMAQRSEESVAKVRTMAAVNDRKSTCYVARLTASTDLDDEASEFAISDDCDPAALTL